MKLLKVPGFQKKRITEKIEENQIKSIDPSLFIHRFCSNLKFGPPGNKKVIDTSLNLIKNMDRDWLVTGRRPNGLCGAAILISARMHGFKRSTEEIAKVVKVGKETIHKRLEEFSGTPAAQLTSEQFSRIDFGCEVPQILNVDAPPSFNRNHRLLAITQESIKIYKEGQKIADEVLGEEKEEDKRNIPDEDYIVSQPIQIEETKGEEDKKEEIREKIVTGGEEEKKEEEHIFPFMFMDENIEEKGSVDSPIIQDISAEVDRKPDINYENKEINPSFEVNN